MGKRRMLYSRKFLLVNLVLVGLILGFSMSLVVFSCSTRIGPSESAAAQETGSGMNVNVGALQSSFRSISDTVLPSVVKITVEEVRTQEAPQGDRVPWFDFFFGQPDSPDNQREFRTQGLGSGIIVRRQGNTYYVLTNDHVVGEADSIQIVLDDERQFSGTLVGKDLRKDIALVSFESKASDIRVATLGDSGTLRVGDWVLAMGSPFGFQSTVTAGIVSALGRRGGPQGNINDFIQTDAAINQGNSGGALVNMNGEVIGINTWITSQTGGSVGLGFSIPINNVKSAIDDFVTTGSVHYGWLGVSIRTPSQEIADAMKLPSRMGAFVYYVFDGSPADKAGIIPGDFITAINGKRMESSDQVILTVGDLDIGEKATFDLIRQGNEESLTVTITERAEESAIAESNQRLWPGLSVFPITDQVRKEAGLEKSLRGVIVNAVESRTPADIAGMRLGDIITAVDGTEITGVMEFYAHIADTKNGKVELTLRREDQTITLTLTR